MKIIFLLAAIGFGAAVPRCGAKLKDLFKPVVGEQKVLNPRIIGGSEAVPHSRPYQAFLEVLDEWGLCQWFCGGMVLSNNYILTTGGCAGLGAFSALVTLGAHDMYDFNEPGKITVTSKNFTVHPENDIAVYKLDEPIEFNDYIQPVTLPCQADAGNSFVGYNATVGGWGYAGTGIGDWYEPSRFLNVLNSPIVPNTQCEEESGWEIPDTQLCLSGADGTGGCKGDSGDPLTVKINDVDTVVGIFSYTAVGCAPAVSGFTRITSNLDWIAANTDAVVN